MTDYDFRRSCNKMTLKICRLVETLVQKLRYSELELKS